MRQSLLSLAGRLLLACAAICSTSPNVATAQVPAMLNFQGRVVVRGGSFDGTGQFKLSLVNADGSSVYWRNAPDANADGEPDAFVSLPVNRGLYSVAIGDTNLTNMTALPANVFTNSTVLLRVWFNDGPTGFQRLLPDQRIYAVGYAMVAGSVSDGAITKDKLAADVTTQMNAFTAVSADPQDAALGSRGYQAFTSISAPAWVNGATTGAPAARSGHTAVWTGQQLLVWGGNLGQGNLSANGGAYQPLPEQWSAISLLNPPVARSGHTAVWTGSEMMIWGGAAAGGYATAGGRFNPVTQNWTVVPAAGAPTGRLGHVTAWTGARMLIWSGLNSTGLLADGALYDPAANVWNGLSAANPPSARYNAAAVWTGNRFIVWGGQGASGPLNTGAQLPFSSGLPQSAWQALATLSAPSARYNHTAVWTGQKMIVWGGRSGGVAVGDGAVYDPVLNVWTALPGANAPSARENHNAIWTGTEMIVTGGENSSGALNTGAAYDPATNKWRPLTNPGSPVARSGATAVWSGTEVLIFGGQANGSPVATLQKLNPQSAWYLYRKL